MLRFTIRRLGVSAFSLFMREQKKNPKLKGLVVQKRTKILSSLYKKLSATEKKALMKRAETAKFRSQKCQAPKNRKRTVSPYNKFVKQNIHKFDKLPHMERMKAVAKLWKIKNKK